MGVTVLYSSGDDGVAGNGGVCLNPDGKSCLVKQWHVVEFSMAHPGSQTRTGSLFNPTFPSTCPYVTSVGATQLPEGARVSPFSPLAPFVAPSDPPETACEVVIASGGGFSNYFARPEWQEGAVRRYLDGKGKGVEEGKWNASGRGYPDISANGCVFEAS
jgi:tripeptidyl-peptidase-1